MTVRRLMEDFVVAPYWSHQMLFVTNSIQQEFSTSEGFEAFCHNFLSKNFNFVFKINLAKLCPQFLVSLPWPLRLWLFLSLSQNLAIRQLWLESSMLCAGFSLSQLLSISLRYCRMTTVSFSHLKKSSSLRGQLRKHSFVFSLI